MPRRSYARVKRKRATYRRKKKYRKKAFASPYVSNSATISGMPNGKVVRLRYDDFSSFISTSGNHSFGTFNVASIYDPLVSGSGTNHQPFGHDQYSVFYNKYIVIGAKVTSKFMWTLNATRLVCVYSILDEDTTLPDYLQIKQERYPAKVKTLVADKTKTVTITNYYSPSKWHKISKSSLIADH